MVKFGESPLLGFQVSMVELLDDRQNVRLSLILCADTKPTVWVGSSWPHLNPVTPHDSTYKHHQTAQQSLKNKTGGV